jgi:hypothetical protein
VLIPPQAGHTSHTACACALPQTLEQTCEVAALLRSFSAAHPLLSVRCFNAQKHFGHLECNVFTESASHRHLMRASAGFSEDSPNWQCLGTARTMFGDDVVPLWHPRRENETIAFAFLASFPRGCLLVFESQELDAKTLPESATSSVDPTGGEETWIKLQTQPRSVRGVPPNCLANEMHRCALTQHAICQKRPPIHPTG